MLTNLELIRDRISAGCKVAIYGAGSAAKKKLITEDWILDFVDYFITTDGKQKKFLGKPVLAVDECELNNNELFVLIISQFDEQISVLLKSRNFNNFICFKHNREEVHDYNLEIYQRLFPVDSLTNKAFYNIGAGGFYHPYWTNVDFISEWYSSYKDNIRSGIHYDLLSLQPLPIESGTAEVIYTSHTIEHIHDAAAQNLFNESYRILKTGGVFRATTPNIDIEYRAYKNNDRHYFYWIDMYGIKESWKKALYNKPLTEASTAQVFLTHFASAVSTLHADGGEERIDDERLAELFRTLSLEDALNYCTSRCPDSVQKKYPGNHMNWWNYKKIETMLRRAGFSNINLSGYGQSQCPVLRDTIFFDSTHPKISLYVEAVK